MTYEQYEKRVVAINGWFDTYIRETFRSVHQFGHLVNNHLNKSDAFLKDRCKKIKKNTSSFCGQEDTILEMLVSIILAHRDEIIEYLANLDTMPDEYADEGLKPCYMFAKFASAEKHNFYEITPRETDIIVSYGCKGDKNSMFSNPRTDSIPKRMYWIKKYEKLANGYADSEQLNFALKKKMLS